MNKAVLFLISILFLTACKKSSGNNEQEETYAISDVEIADSVSLNDYEHLTSGSAVRGSHFRFTYPTTLAQGPRGFDWISSTTEPVNKYHSGIDYAVSNSYRGRPVYAVASGRIASVISNCNSDHGIGNQVIIEHKMKTGSNIFSLYGHMENFASGINTGKYVPKGTIIGYIGQTAYCRNSGTSAGGVVHLHFEMKNSNTTGSNPAGYWGYVPKTSTVTSATAKGYLRPSNYINSAVNLFEDITVNSALPATIRRNQPFTCSVSIYNPYTLPSNVDLRLALYSSGASPVFQGEIQTYLNNQINYSGSRTFTFSKSAITSVAGSNYELRVEVRFPASSNEWYVLPTTKGNASFMNPQTVSITN